MAPDSVTNFGSGKTKIVSPTTVAQSRPAFRQILKTKISINNNKIKFLMHRHFEVAWQLLKVDTAESETNEK